MKKKFKFIPRRSKPKNVEINTISFEEIIAIRIAENEAMPKIRAERDSGSNINFQTKIWQILQKFGRKL